MKKITYQNPTTMRTQNTDFLLNEAGQLIKAAKNDLSLAEEGIVNYMVCQNSRQALIKSMTYFLFKNGVEPKGLVTTENLLKQCREVDPRFKKVDLSNVLCRHQEGDDEYCLSTDKVSKCFRSAEEVHSIVAKPVSGL